MKYLGWILIFLLAVAFAEEEDVEVCLAPAQLTISHHFGRGVGHKAYTSAELFFVQSQYPNFIPYLDTRFHVMNNGRFASNVGTGFRYLMADDLFSAGMNVFYDFRDSKELNTHQVAGGVELLSPFVDFRLNGYLPVGGTKHSEPLVFNGFTRNQIDVRRKTYYAFPSMNAEIGVPTPMIPGIYTDFYVAGGAYYLFGSTISGNRCPSAWGGKLRVIANVTQYVSFEFEMNHDHIFDTTYQGVASIHIPLWKFSACKKGNRSYGKRAFYMRTLRPVLRNEIIPVKTKSRIFPLRDARGNIIPIFFVNNAAACPGVGTFESPFCSFNLVPNLPVIVYGFQGNHSYTDAIVMSEGQRVQGSALPFNVEGVEIPAFTSGNPVLDVTGTSPVTLASNGSIRGFTIQRTTGGNDAIQSGVLVTNVVIEQNTILQSSGSGINIVIPNGSIYIANNVVQNTGQFGIMVGNIMTSSVVVTGNTIRNPGMDGINTQVSGSNASSMITYNTISGDNIGPSGITSGVDIGSATISYNTITGRFFNAINATNGRQIISNNIIDRNSTVTSPAILFGGLFSPFPPNAAPVQGYITDNSIRNTNGDGIQVLVDPGSTVVKSMFAQVHDNFVEGDPTRGIRYDVSAPGQICTSITENAAPVFQFNGTAGPVLVKQPRPVFEQSNLSSNLTNISGVVIFGSQCSPP